MFVFFLLQMLNPLNVRPSRTLITVDQLDSFMPDDEVLKPIPDKKFFIAMDFNTVENPRFHDNRYYPLKTMMNKHGQGIHVQHMLSPQLNHISFKLPSSPPLSQSSHNTEVRNFSFLNSQFLYFFFFISKRLISVVKILGKKFSCEYLNRIYIFQLYIEYIIFINLMN